MRGVCFTEVFWRSNRITKNWGSVQHVLRINASTLSISMFTPKQNLQESIALPVTELSHNGVCQALHPSLKGVEASVIINKMEQEGVFIECSPLQSRLPQLQQTGFQSFDCESLSGNYFRVVVKSSSCVRGVCLTHIRASWHIFPLGSRGRTSQKGWSYVLKETHMHIHATHIIVYLIISLVAPSYLLICFYFILFSLLRCGFSTQPNKDDKLTIYPHWFLTWDPSASASLLMKLQMKIILFNTLTQFF